MVMIPKQKKTEKVINPFRPKIGLPREYSLCRISWGDYHVEYDEVERWLRVDADHNDKFIAELEATVPNNERYRCLDKEIWLVNPKWKNFVVGLAKRSFDKVDATLRDW